MSESKKDNCTSVVERLFEKYKDDEYMTQRIYNHVSVHLPHTLENEAKNHERRQNLNSYLSEEQQIFIQVFLSKHNYFHLHTNGLFYEYNGKDYFIVKEDEIIHKLLSTISKERVLLQWKYKTKINIIKQIKERNLFTSIPETDTIQSVLNMLYPSIFQSKSAAKYFLTIVGDNVLKKSSNLVFLVSAKMKQLLHELQNVGVLSIGTDSTCSRFVTKYHETHSFENIRLVYINEHVSQDYWREILKRIGLNLLCVAAHYSKRYLHSDHFLDNCSDDQLMQQVYTLKNTTPTQIVQRFVGNTIQTTSEITDRIEWKNLHFMWKQFLSGLGLPNVVFSNTLKSTLCEMLNYDKETDSFQGIISKYLPVYKDFIQFVSSTIVSVPASEFENELEIDEIHSLFKSKNRSALTEETIIKIVKHFFPSFEIVEDKYVLHVTSTMWNKVEDIRASIPFIKEQIKLQHTMSLISFDDLYAYYQKFVSSNTDMKYVVSKRFFEKYLYCQCGDYVEYEKFIRVDWIER